MFSTSSCVITHPINQSTPMLTVVAVILQQTYQLGQPVEAMAYQSVVLLLQTLHGLVHCHFPLLHPFVQLQAGVDEHHFAEDARLASNNGKTAKPHGTRYRAIVRRLRNRGRTVSVASIWGTGRRWGCTSFRGQPAPWALHPLICPKRMGVQMRGLVEADQSRCGL